MQDASSPSSSAEAEDRFSPRDVLHWYDFLCPFCYVSQGRSEILERHGFHVIDLPFEAHPDIPAVGRIMATRSGPMYDQLEAEARAAHLRLKWPPRLPNTRMALAAAEWARRHAPTASSAFEKALFAAHFALGEDLGDRETIVRYAAEVNIDTSAMTAALDDWAAYHLVDRSEALARQAGVHATPAWLVAGRLIPGLYPKEQFAQLVQVLAMDERPEHGSNEVRHHSGIL